MNQFGRQRGYESSGKNEEKMEREEYRRKSDMLLRRREQQKMKQECRCWGEVRKEERKEKENWEMISDVRNRMRKKRETLNWRRKCGREYHWLVWQNVGNCKSEKGKGRKGK